MLSFPLRPMMCPFLMVSGKAFTKQAQRASANEGHIDLKKKKIVFLECLWEIKGNDSLEWVVWKNLSTEVIIRLKHERWERNIQVKLAHTEEMVGAKVLEPEGSFCAWEAEEGRGSASGGRMGPTTLWSLSSLCLSVLSENFAPLLLWECPLLDSTNLKYKTQISKNYKENCSFVSSTYLC